MTPLCIHRLPTTGSTNDDVMRLLRENAPDGTVVWAERQTGGKGRIGRTWHSPPGNLYLSILARVNMPAALAGRVAVTCGRAVALALREITDLPVRTKWPNDVYLHGRKIGGILVETRLTPGARVSGVVAGLGLNVANHPDIAPPGQPATSLAAHGILPNDLQSLAEPLALALRDACHMAVREDWLPEISATNALEISGTVRVWENGEEYDAEVIGPAWDGALTVRRADGVRRLTAADVSVRPRAV